MSIAEPEKIGPDAGAFEFSGTEGFVEDTAGFSLRDVAPEDWLTLVLFWVIGCVVFLQFFTRYVLNSSAAWTEEFAIYGLMVLTFIGSAIAVRRNSHIHIEFIYQYLPARVAFALSTLVDVIRIALFAICTYLGVHVTQLMQFQMMVYVEVSLSWIFGACTFGFAVLTIRAVQVAFRHWRMGGSALTNSAVQVQVV